MACAADRTRDEAQASSFRLHGTLTLVELPDAAGGELQRIAVGRVDPLQLPLESDLERLPGGRSPAVEAPSELAQRGVAFGPHALADLAHRRALGRKPRQVEPRARERRLPPGRGVELLNHRRPLGVSTPPPARARSAS